MDVEELSIPGCFVFTPAPHPDDRGTFFEWFKSSTFRATVGADLQFAQANASVSAAGVLRGIHYTESPPGQAKLITCPHGAFFDVAVDLRTDSPTFGQWDSVLLDDDTHRVVYLPEGIGHAVLALAADSALLYLVSIEYTPGIDHEISVFDPAIGIEWPTVGRTGKPLRYRLSPKDDEAPTLDVAQARGLLPKR